MNQAFTYRPFAGGCTAEDGQGSVGCVQDVRLCCGPELFGGWARRGDVYRCDEHGCDCGWYFEYEPGEPMGVRHPSPLIQLTANSQEQVKQRLAIL
jgi:hypothetical protein